LSLSTTLKSLQEINKIAVKKSQKAVKKQ